MARRTLITVGAGVGALVMAFGAQAVLGSSPASAQGLSKYNDCDEFLTQQRADLRARANAYGIDGVSLFPFYGNDTVRAETQALTSSSLALPMTSDSAAGSAGAGTGTNLQEKGVDEPDLAKLADGRIVLVSDGVLKVLSTGDTPQAPWQPRPRQQQPLQH